MLRSGCRSKADRRRFRFGDCSRSWKKGWVRIGAARAVAGEGEEEEEEEGGVRKKVGQAGRQLGRQTGGMVGFGLGAPFRFGGPAWRWKWHKRRRG